jgi:hypothetical protein
MLPVDDDGHVSVDLIESREHRPQIRGHVQSRSILYLTRELELFVQAFVCASEHGHTPAPEQGEPFADPAHPVKVAAEGLPGGMVMLVRLHEPVEWLKHRIQAGLSGTDLPGVGWNPKVDRENMSVGGVEAGQTFDGVAIDGH